MVSAFAMSKHEVITALYYAVEALFRIPDLDLDHSAEDDLQFRHSVALADVSSFAFIVETLGPHTGLFQVIFEKQIQNASAATILTEQGDLEILDRWTEDADLTPANLDQDSSNIVEHLAKLLSEEGKVIAPQQLLGTLKRLADAGGDVKISVQITLDKSAFYALVSWPTDVKGLMYISPKKFLRSLNLENLQKIDRLLSPGSESLVVLLLGGATGRAVGPNLKILGRDCWLALSFDDLEVDQAEKKRVQDINRFRYEECHWDVHASAITPFHLHTDTNELNDRNLAKHLNQVRDYLCVAHLANRLRIGNGQTTCEFLGHKLVKVVMPKVLDVHPSPGFFKLFLWAYENSSSDKISILRQIVSILLNGDASDNYRKLLESGNEILGIAKSNFQLFLRRSVELYFDKRIRVNEFFQKYSKEVGENLSHLTTELVNNLYKTVGIILGAVIAALIDPNQTRAIIFWTSSLYLIYILFILVYLLPSTYVRFSGISRAYLHSRSELRDVLTEDEISRIEGQIYQRTRYEFLVFFSLTKLGYAAIGTFAYLIMRSVESS